MSFSKPLATAPDRSRWYVRALNNLLARAGLRITSHRKRLNLSDACRHLHAIGMRPNTLVDVGVAWGTDDLYSAFADAELLLVEPNRGWEQACDKILGSRRGRVVYEAAGAENGSLTLHIWRGAEGSSSLWRESIPDDADIEAVEVPIRRLDQIVKDSGLKGPYVVKIDVQGAEFDVLSGMDGILHETEAIVIETTLFTGGAGKEFDEVVAKLRQMGFSLYDIVGANYRPRDRSLASIDAVFVKSDGIARQNASWD